MKAIVCDDDPTLRTVVSRLLADTGHAVLAETDSAIDAVDMVLRFGAEVLVLDQSLPHMTGMDGARELQRAASNCYVVVFTAYAGDSPEARQAGVWAVVQKPDFDALEAVLADLASGPRITLPSGEERRRRPYQHQDMPRPGHRTPSGLEDPEVFAAVAYALLAGDTALVIHVAEATPKPGWFARTEAIDHLLAVARCLRTVLRIQDRMTVDDPQGEDHPCELLALLVSGGPVGATAAFDRLEVAHRALDLPGVINGGWAEVGEGTTGPAAVARARSAALRSVGTPEGERLWTG